MGTFTVNTTTTRGEWLIIDAYSADVSSSTELLTDITGHEYLLKSISVDINESDKWFKVFDDTTLRIGPVRPRGVAYHREYESPIRIDGAVNIQTESNNQIHITIAYKIHEVS